MYGYPRKIDREDKSKKKNFVILNLLCLSHEINGNEYGRRNKMRHILGVKAHEETGVLLSLLFS